jgi:hypothetical protein
MINVNSSVAVAITLPIHLILTKSATSLVMRSVPQSKLIVESILLIAGAPSKKALLKYSAYHPP